MVNKDNDNHHDYLDMFHHLNKVNYYIDLFLFDIVNLYNLMHINIKNYLFDQYMFHYYNKVLLDNHRYLPKQYFFFQSVKSEIFPTSQ
jgi:hypothetical protein